MTWCCRINPLIILLKKYLIIEESPCLQSDMPIKMSRATYSCKCSPKAFHYKLSMFSKLTYLLSFKFSWVTCYWLTVCLVVAAYKACAKFLLSSHSDAVVRTTFQDFNPSLFVSRLCVVRKFYCFPFFVLPSNAYVMLYNCRKTICFIHFQFGVTAYLSCLSYSLKL